MRWGELGLGAACVVSLCIGVLACSSDDDQGTGSGAMDASALSPADAGLDSGALSPNDAQAPGLSVGPQDGGAAGQIDTSMPILEAAIADGGIVTFASPLFADDSEGADDISGSYGGAQLVLRLPDPPSFGTYGCGAAGAVTSMQYGTAANPFTAPQADGGASCTIDVTGFNGGAVEGTFSGRLYSADAGSYVDVADGMFRLPFTAFLTP